ncbi:Ndufb8, NADH dehydrogenase 19kDa subunit [Artomyces pyxidatus]|uniref:Ndufb8, NADH dehydrogenase 19kDa subunit n=1 Tax=Artomyces pyxidatus TaxID=48021 RepID=A0ACB8TAI3_9AGAM|nr:Ndufb8, NADH dehydrogenase 19kDa subunit [Artomyces pyxidatus]
MSLHRVAGVRAVAKAKQSLPLAPNRSLLVRTYVTPVPYQKKELDPQLNGYPQLPDISRQTLPAKGWWDWQMRRNMGDIMHEREEMFSMWGPDVPHVQPSVALKQFSLAFAGFVAFGFFCNYALVPERPSVPRQYPYDGLVVELGGLEENKSNVESLEDDEE